MSVSLHTIAFKGPAGITFILLMLASIFFILGFGSTGWAKLGTYHVGLWQTCYSGEPINQAYFVTTQVFMCFGFAGLIAAVVLASLYMCVDQISKNLTLLALAITCFAAGLAMFIGIVVFGAESPYSPDWSFAMAVIGMCFTLGAGATSVVQMHRSDVPCLCCKQ